MAKTLERLVLVSLSLCIIIAVSTSAAPLTLALNFNQENLQLQDLPSQLRLAVVPHGMCVSFTTQYPINTKPLVKYGTSASNLSSSTTGRSHSYGTSFFHDVVLPSLQPRTLYFYQSFACNSTASTSSPQCTSSAIFNFTTVTEAGNEHPMRVGIVGDMGLVNSANTFTSMLDFNPQVELWTHIGDISYADEFMNRGDTYESAWDHWQTWMQPVTQHKPYMTLPGNHEVTCDEDHPETCPVGQRNLTAYRHRFRMPGAESGGLGNLWYSFDIGLFHWIHLDFETDFPDAPSGINSTLHGGGETTNGQIDWLFDDLTKANQNRNQVPWIIASAHRPIYSSGGSCDSCGAAFESLFNKFGVDVYFAGHVHWYERLYAISPGGVVENKDYRNPTAPVYIVNGAAGNIEGHSTGSALPFSAVIDESDYGVGILSLVNRTTIEFAFYRSTDRSLVDRVTIVKEKYAV